MAFRTFCNNKGCGKEQEPLLNLDTNEVLCGECGKSISSLTSFAKATLKSMKQTTKNVKSQEPYSVKCSSCKREGQPNLSGADLVCKFCKTVLTGLSKPFELTVKHALKKAAT